jgi:hypothetical protein
MQGGPQLRKSGGPQLGNPASNVRDAICSVFIIMARLGFLEVIGSRMNAPGGAWQGIDRFRDVPFALHYEIRPPGSLSA